MQRGITHQQESYSIENDQQKPLFTLDRWPSWGLTGKDCFWELSSTFGYGSRSQPGALTRVSTTPVWNLLAAN